MSSYVLMTDNKLRRLCHDPSNQRLAHVLYMNKDDDVRSGYEELVVLFLPMIIHPPYMNGTICFLTFD